MGALRVGKVATRPRISEQIVVQQIAGIPDRCRRQWRVIEASDAESNNYRLALASTPAVSSV